MSRDWNTAEESRRLEELPGLLAGWYRAEARELPWRSDPSPYRVWISEIMLQQTRIETVREYFARFVREFPDLPSLAGAEEERVLKLWEGLGYYSRARNLLRTARICCERYGGDLPESYRELLDLPGIGPYTAGAVGSIAMRLPVPAVDGNVLRVFSRLLADDTGIDADACRRKISSLAAELMPEEDPGLFNQALMELGERVCIPAGVPRCESCPARSLCLAAGEGRPELYPVRTPKRARRTEQYTVLLICCGGRYAVRRRPGRGLLAGMYEFPSLPGHRTREEMHEWLSGKTERYELRELPAARHIFSHVEWDMTGWRIDVPEEWTEDWAFAARTDFAEKFPLPSAFRVYRECMEAV